MKPTLRSNCYFLFTCLIGLMAFPLGAQIASPMQLWEKASKFWVEGQAWMPGKAVSLSEELDDKDRVEKSTEVQSLVVLSDKGEIKYEVLKATENGRDITEDRRRNPRSQDRDQPPEIFDPQFKNQIILKYLSLETLEGLSLHKISFYLKPKDKTGVVGTAWLNAQTGAPYYLEYTLDPLPFLAESLSIKTRYKTQDTGVVIEEVSFQGSGTVLFIKKTIRSRIRLSEHRLKKTSS